MNIKFAENFTNILRSRGVSQSLFAKLFGVKPNTVNQWANGKREPDLESLIKICILLGIDFNEILGYNFYKRIQLNVLEDIIGENREFKKEQEELSEKLFKQGEHPLDVQNECGKLFIDYVEKYKAALKSNY